MEHLPTLVSDLALILLVASITTLLFKWLKQPVILGYIISGFLISPHFNYLPTVADIANIEVWAEIGIIFLLFSLGLEFSFKKLLQVGSTVLIAGMINISSLIAVGYAVGYMFGWTNMECIFLGGMLSMSSTTIIIKAFDELGLKKQSFSRIVFGILIIEDLVAILMMVLLSTMAVSRDFEGLTLLMQLLKLIFFVIIWLVVGIFLIPTMLDKLKRFLNDEVLLILSIGLCLGMVLFATSVGFSAALGAFIMGSIFAETHQVKQIEHLLDPLKNLFGAVFFISVGMMLEPGVITEYAVPILAITAVVIIGNLVFATLGIVAAGESLKTAIYSGFSLAQIGEFSFIIATLGMQLGVISSFLYPIIVSISVITAFVTPFLMKLSAPTYNKLEAAIPLKWNKLLVGYLNAGNDNFKETNKLRSYVKSALTSIIVYTLLCIAILFLAHRFLLGYITMQLPGTGGLILYSVLTILAMAVFINGIAHAGAAGATSDPSALRLGRLDSKPTGSSANAPGDKSAAKEKRTWNSSFKAQVAQHLHTENSPRLLIISLLKTLIPPILIAVVLMPVFPQIKALLVLLSIIIAVGFVLAPRLRERSMKIESQFKENLKDTVPAEEFSQKIKSELNKKSIHIERLVVPQHYANIGKTLSELNFRKSTGVSIVSIIRGEQVLNIPDRHTRIFPFDKLVIVGSDEEVQKMITVLESKSTNTNPMIDPLGYRVELYQYGIEADSALIGKSLRQLEIQKKTACIVTGIERDGLMVVKFSADYVFKENDVLWIAGEKKNLALFEQSLLAVGEKKYMY